MGIEGVSRIVIISRQYMEIFMFHFYKVIGDVPIKLKSPSPQIPLSSEKKKEENPLKLELGVHRGLRSIILFYGSWMLSYLLILHCLRNPEYISDV